MRLNFQKLGAGHPLVILHGLYGSGENWLTIGKGLAGISAVYLPDQRNHGASPWSGQMDYPSMAADLREFLDDQGISQAILLGHSMGGKTAMRFAAENQGRVSRLIIADISPRSYLDDNNLSAHNEQHQSIIGALSRVDLPAAFSIGDVDRQLESVIKNKRLRMFLLKNLHKNEKGLYEWKINLTSIRDNLIVLAGGIGDEAFMSQTFRSFPVLFIRGENSNYININGDDPNLIRRIFPLAQITTIKNTGHWLHAEQPELFTRIVKQFILKD